MYLTLITILVAALVAVMLALIAPAFNRLVGLRNRAEQAFATIDVMLRRRYDLVPNLVACVTGYLAHERQTLTDLTALRTKALSGGLSREEIMEVNKSLAGYLARIMVAVEAYPQLRSSDNFLHLQRSLNEVEEQLAAARRAFNAAATEYNTGIQVFPANMVANLFRFDPRPLFEAPETERSTPNVGALLRT